MKADLAAVNRAITPWVVGLVHKAWWMESEAYADFTPVLVDGGVDIIFTGHWHYYSRYKVREIHAHNSAFRGSRSLPLPSFHFHSPITTSRERWMTRASLQMARRTRTPRP